jgi:hypothetical protein
MGNLHLEARDSRRGPRGAAVAARWGEVAKLIFSYWTEKPATTNAVIKAEDALE